MEKMCQLKNTIGSIFFDSKTQYIDFIDENEML